MKYNALVPEFYVTNFQTSLNFYTKALGFDIEYQRSNPSFAFLSYGETQLMIQELSETDGPEWNPGSLEYPFGRGLNFQIATNDIDGLVNSIESAGHSLRKEIWDSWYEVEDKLVGCRQILVLDPDGYLLRFSQDLGTKAKAE